MAFAKANNIQVTDELLTRVLTLHVFPSGVYSTKTALTADSLSKDPVTVQLKDGSVLVNGKGNATPAKVELADVIFDKGVIHVIDAVLVPGLKTLSGTTSSPSTMYY